MTDTTEPTTTETATTTPEAAPAAFFSTRTDCSVRISADGVDMTFCAPDVATVTAQVLSALELADSSARLRDRLLRERRLRGAFLGTDGHVDDIDAELDRTRIRKAITGEPSDDRR